MDSTSTSTMTNNNNNHNNNHNLINNNNNDRESLNSLYNNLDNFIQELSFDTQPTLSETMNLPSESQTQLDNRVSTYEDTIITKAYYLKEDTSSQDSFIEEDSESVSSNNTQHSLNIPQQQKQEQQEKEEEKEEEIEEIEEEIKEMEIQLQQKERIEQQLQLTSSNLLRSQSSATTISNTSSTNTLVGSSPIQSPSLLNIGRSTSLGFLNVIYTKLLLIKIQPFLPLVQAL
ncbi:unnamed protein product [Cunninghamella blakesleeana]